MTMNQIYSPVLLATSDSRSSCKMNGEGEGGEGGKGVLSREGWGLGKGRAALSVWFL